jgi:hypothetical protein
MVILVVAHVIKLAVCPAFQTNFSFKMENVFLAIIKSSMAIKDVILVMKLNVCLV